VTFVPFTNWPASQDVPSQCTGDVYWPVSVDECGCGTMMSYAICGDMGTFTECACSIPKHYTVAAPNPIPCGPAH
jgi:hypothetical protein